MSFVKAELLVFFLTAARCASSQADCTEILTITPSQVLYAPQGTVCFQCDFGSGVATDSQFQLNNAAVEEEVGSVRNGILTVFAAEEVFSTALETLSCTNDAGTRISAFVLLERLQPPVVPEAISIAEGETLVLECDTSNSIPHPDVSWIYPDGQVIPGNRAEVVNIERSQAGDYTCVVMSDENTESSTTVVTVKWVRTVDEPMINVINSTAVHLQWRPPRYDPELVAGYIVTHMKQGGGEGYSLNLNNQTTEVTVVHLDKGTVYVFTITAVDSAGNGEPYIFDATETFVDAPSLPQNVRVSAPDPFTIDVSWSKPASDGGRQIISYTIQLLTPGMNFPPIELPGNSKTHHIRDLQENTTYEVRVAAINADDKESVYVNITQTTPAVGNPQPPLLNTHSTFMIGNTSAVVSWKTPDGYPFRYIVQYKLSSVADWSNNSTTMTLTLSSTMHSAVLTDLQPLTAYDVRLQSENANGISDFTARITFNTYGSVVIRGDSVSTGGTLTLKCGLDGAEDGANITYTWTIMNGQLPSGASVGEGGVLVIFDAQVKDSNVYICTANGVTGSINITVREPEDGSGASVSVVWITVGCAAGGVVITLTTCAIICVIRSRRKSTKSLPLNNQNKEGVDSVNPGAAARYSCHLYETLPMNNRQSITDILDSKPVTFTTNEAYGSGAVVEPSKDIIVEEYPPTLDNMYVRVREGVTRMPEEIYDQMLLNQVQQVTIVGESGEEEEDGYEEAYESESEKEDCV